MSSSPQTQANIENWRIMIRQFKEGLAKNIWAVPTLAEAEKELLFKEMLTDLDSLERNLGTFSEEMVAQRKTFKEENDLLRSLLGMTPEDLRTKFVGVSHDLEQAQERLHLLEEELQILKKQMGELQEENSVLRKSLKERDKTSAKTLREVLQSKEEDIKFFWDTHEDLKNQIMDLESRLLNLRELFKESNKKVVEQKQEEIAALEKKILTEMEEALRQKQKLMMAEEELFTKGVAQKLRTGLVSVQGQLFLTLERLGILDPESKNEAFWTSRFKIFSEGTDELAKNFKSIQGTLADVTKALDDFLHLTHRREWVEAPVSLLGLVKQGMADFYVERQPKLIFQLMEDDILPDVKGDPELIAFMVRTLFQNAMEALPDGAGQILVTLKNRAFKNMVELTMRNTGYVIPGHLVSRVFQPFFSSKPGHQGLSLSRAKRYAQLLGGDMVLVGSSQEGTIFQLTLPLMGSTA